MGSCSYNNLPTLCVIIINIIYTVIMLLIKRLTHLPIPSRVILTFLAFYY